MAFERNILKFAVAASAFATMSAAQATTLTVNASVTVDNAVNLTEDGTPLDFGTIRATADGTDATDCVGLVMSADPNDNNANTTLAGDAATACTAAGTATMSQVAGAYTRPQFEVAGLPAFQTLTLTLPSGLTSVALNPAPAGAVEFQLSDFTAWDVIADAAVTTTLTADAAGLVQFTVGATLTTDDGTNGAGGGGAVYQDTSYAATFDVTVVY